VPLIVIQRQLGHSNLGITSIYLQGIDNADHRHRPRPASADGPGQHVATALRARPREGRLPPLVAHSDSEGLPLTAPARRPVGASAV
jgi:hypothetical protein